MRLSVVSEIHADLALYLTIGVTRASTCLATTCSAWSRERESLGDESELSADPSRCGVARASERVLGLWALGPRRVWLLGLGLAASLFGREVSAGDDGAGGQAVSRRRDVHV